MQTVIMCRRTLSENLHRKFRKCSGTRVPSELFELWIDHRQVFFYLWKSRARMHKYLENFDQS